MEIHDTLHPSTMDQSRYSRKRRAPSSDGGLPQTVQQREPYLNHGEVWDDEVWDDEEVWDDDEVWDDGEVWDDSDGGILAHYELNADGQLVMVWPGDLPQRAHTSSAEHTGIFNKDTIDIPSEDDHSDFEDYSCSKHHQSYLKDNHDVFIPTRPEGKGLFRKFMQFPPEIRERVYGFVLASDRPIAPHLCDAERHGNIGMIRFHDGAEPESWCSPGHNATYRRMAITRVSRAVRCESLPVFYSANTFLLCADLPTYIDRLAHLGRFHMIRNIVFPVDFTPQLMAPKALRAILQVIAEQEDYEKNIVESNLDKYRSQVKTTYFDSEKPPHGQNSCSPTAKQMELDCDVSVGTQGSSAEPPLVPYKPDLTRFFAESRTELVEHPQHISGGLPWISTFLVLRKLASEFTSAGSSDYSHKIVLHVPTLDIFTRFDQIAYFPAICEALGMKLYFVDGREVEWNNRVIKFSWHQRYQKKDFHTSTNEEGTDEQSRQQLWDVEGVSKRVRGLYPNLDDFPRPVRTTYNRRNCSRTEIEWFSVESAGGGKY